MRIVTVADTPPSGGLPGFFLLDSLSMTSSVTKHVYCGYKNIDTKYICGYNIHTVKERPVISKEWPTGARTPMSRCHNLKLG